MKKIITLFSLTLAFGALQAQNVEVYPKDGTVEGSHEEYELVVHAHMKNISATDSFVHWKRIENNLQSGWESAICDQVTCYAATVDSSAVVLHQGDSSILDLHFYLNNTAGTGHVKVMVWAGNDMANADTAEFTATTWAVNVAKVSNDKEVKIYPNPAGSSLNLDFNTTGTVKVEIFDVLGKKLKSFSHNGESSTYNIGDLPNGLYVIRITENGKVYSRSFRKAN